jgi:undecaprenyl-diphosphatase
VPILHAIVLGAVQGLSEFLPISSSGHLALVPWLFGWNDFGGDEALAKAFDVALHLGTLAGALTYFRRDVALYTREGLRAVLPGRPASHDGRLAWMLLLSALPAAVTGAALDATIERLDDEIWLIAALLIVFGLVLLWADRLKGDRVVDDFRPRDAVLMGVGQALALQPGVSRSGVTITVGRRLGFARDSAARLSFLMSLPIIAGAGLYKLASVAADGGIPSSLWPPFVAGVLTSAVTGWVAVWGTLRLVRRRSFTPFVVYRVVVGLAVLGVLASTFR